MHHNNVEYYDVSSGDCVEHYNRISLRNRYASGMGIKLQQIANRQREAIRRIIHKYDLEIAPLCKKAGFSEGTLRHFLNVSAKKPTKAMGSDKIEALSIAMGVPVSELLGITQQQKDAYYSIDASLLRECSDEIRGYAKEINKTLTFETTQELSIKLYNSIMEDEVRGSKTAPSRALASFIVKQSVA